jgi:hypothetical protein
MSLELLAEELDVSTCRGQDSQQHLKGSGFARTVWSEKPQDLSWLELERNIVYGEEILEALSEVLSRDSGSHTTGSKRADTK